MGMPRKIRELKADLRKAGFVEQRDRGKGSHSFWVHPAWRGKSVTIPGRDGDDAKDYLEKHVREAIAHIQAVDRS
jgi:predicted RNA binding protein YcfA (HicA-like mRNA interferase family)